MASEQVSSIIRALEILECFMDINTEWTLKSLVNRLCLPTTTVHRQLSTLTERGYLIQDPIRKSYQVGPRLLLLSSMILSHSDLRRTAHPEMERLSRTVKETINLSIMMGHEIFYLDKEESFRSVVCNTKIGTRAPAHATSGGKIMLANLGDAFVDEYCAELSTMPKLTEKTTTSEQQLRSELKLVREQGYAVDNEEVEPGLTCIGAPIIGQHQRILGAISIAGPTFRMENEMETMSKEVKQSAGRISQLLGGRVY